MSTALWSVWYSFSKDDAKDIRYTFRQSILCLVHPSFMADAISDWHTVGYWWRQGSIKARVSVVCPLLWVSSIEIGSLWFRLCCLKYFCLRLTSHHSLLFKHCFRWHGQTANIYFTWSNISSLLCISDSSLEVSQRWYSMFLWFWILYFRCSLFSWQGYLHLCLRTRYLSICKVSVTFLAESLNLAIHSIFYRVSQKVLLFGKTPKLDCMADFKMSFLGSRSNNK